MAATGIKSLSQKRSDVFHINLEDVTIEDGFNVREDYGDMDELAMSIASCGQKYPGLVRLSGDGTKAVLTDGHRRYQAIQMANEKYGAKITTFKCIKEERGANEETRILDMLNTALGKPLTAIEQAKAVKRLVDYGMSFKEIGRAIGKSQSAVNRLLDLNGATSELRTAVQKKRISASAAAALARKGSDVQKKVLASSNGDKLKVSDVQKATVGKTYILSAKKVRDALAEITTKAKEKRTARLEGVSLGLKIALGEATLEDALS